MKYFWSVGLFTLLLIGSARAHPVIYQDGIVVSSMNMPSMSDNQLMYSLTSKWAVGVNHWRFNKDDLNTEYGLAKVNHLLYRKNGEDSQANVYLHAGLGVVDAEWGAKRATEESYMAGAEVDAETRTLYTSWKYYHFYAPDLLDVNVAQGRIGFSPYTAGFDELQTWFMLQGSVVAEVDKKLMLTPMLRFFYKNVLWEIGSSTRGDWMLNVMVHY